MEQIIIIFFFNLKKSKIFEIVLKN